MSGCPVEFNRGQPKVQEEGPEFIRMSSSHQNTSFNSLMFNHTSLVKRAPFKKPSEGRSQDGGGIGRADHFLSYKFIKRITEHRANFTKQLLIAS